MRDFIGYVRLLLGCGRDLCCRIADQRYGRVDFIQSQAIYPRLFSGNDDKLYTTWNGKYFHIKEAYIESGDIHWQETYRPSCDPTTAIDDFLCGLGVRERHSAMVDGDYGAMSWLKDVDGTKSVFISISTN
ncbi:hypothetical protein [Vibrio vulnificus]|uniref:hypothetical protein n=1 Tax=Vibrio vulnificus TaxID=672 RepID=UPI001A17FAE9|nr:hypothetical protein [Vibrio vulnificus]HAS6415373.1 hypothetical protein [Vibrio vulnificus]HDY7429220.1 hypothetical protein [Vibrio vulnificus]HDY7488994.1 hypothetical protein [Vibrio vulnificus]HDY7951733.1 hypothetical protein [Vibrio vulnificus]